MDKRVQTAKYIVSDFISSSVVWLLFNLMRYREVAVYEGFDTINTYLYHTISQKGQLLIPFFWLGLFWLSGYYNRPYGRSRLTELFSTLLSVMVGVVILFFVLVLNDLPRSYKIYYDMFFTLFIMQFVGIYIPRLIITQRGIAKIKRGELALRLLVIGVGEKALSIANELKEMGYNIVGFIDDNLLGQSHYAVEKIVGDLDSLESCVRSGNVDELVVAIESEDCMHLTDILYSLYYFKLPIKVLADKCSSLSRVRIKTIKGVPLVDITDNNFLPIEQNVKLLMDKLVSFISLLVLSPLFIYIALRVKCDSKGPVFFRQERIGYMGKPFTIYKFRTMYVGSESNGPSLSSEEDSRVTPFGRVMRKYRLDELPQFWNVLKGDMSLVGPRPERKYFIDKIVATAPYYYLLHNVKPGITSLGMVKYGYAGNVEQMIERLKFDIIYYENMSLLLDLTILIYTVKTVITGKGV